MAALEILLVLPSSGPKGDFAWIGEGLVFAAASLLYGVRALVIVPLALSAERSGAGSPGRRRALLLTYLTPVLVLALHALVDARPHTWSRVWIGYLSGPEFAMVLLRL